MPHLLDAKGGTNRREIADLHQLIKMSFKVKCKHDKLCIVCWLKCSQEVHHFGSQILQPVKLL